MRRFALGLLAALVLPLVGCLDTGHPAFMSPHGVPIAHHAALETVYATNTAADQIEVIDATGAAGTPIPVGIDPVSLALRPDGRELWVANHISDSVSVIDTDPASPTFHQVIATVQAFTDGVTRFDEPVGIAFASDAKAYVALSSRNEIAVVDVASRAVTRWIEVEGQDPRVLKVHGDRLFVIPFESGNQTQLSGCFGAVVDPVRTPWCTYDAVIEAGRNNILTLSDPSNPDDPGMVADIIRNQAFPDRDLFVIDTATDEPIEEVWTIGTLLYGLAVDSQGVVYVAQTEARNDANGLAGTQGHDLPEMENRAFLNQIGVVDCQAGCGAPSVIELEPLPPADPAPGTQVATPFGIEISGDDRTLVVTAAGSNRVFTVDAASGSVLGRADVGTTPRGVALESDEEGAPTRAWVFNAVENSVSVVDVSDPTAPTVTSTIAFDDPTHPEVKLGRAAFNDAGASTTGTFSCESCHPDGHTDQLLWILGARCDVPGCNQVQPRSTMPIRGLRDTLPLHWDGVLSDPFGGINTESLLASVDPTCSEEHECFRELVDASLGGTMCDQHGACPTTEGLAGALDGESRDAMAVFLRSVPYPPARSRPVDDDLSPLARQGFDDFLDNEGRRVCSRCHNLPFWVRTNTPGSGMDAPTFRGTTDRFLTLPNGRIYLLDLIGLSILISDAPWTEDQVPDEYMMWAFTFGSARSPQLNRTTSGHGPEGLFQMFEEGSTGFSGAMGRQVTLNAATTDAAALAETAAMLDLLERADDFEAVNLRVEGGEAGAGGAFAPLSLSYQAGEYFRHPYDGGVGRSRESLIDAARAGALVATATARLGPKVDVDHPQPGLWTDLTGGGSLRRHALPRLPGDSPMAFRARHLAATAFALVDGERVDATITCQDGSRALPRCPDEGIHITLAELPAPGQHLIQVMNPGGLASNEVLFFVD